MKTIILYVCSVLLMLSTSCLCSAAPDAKADAVVSLTGHPIPKYYAYRDAYTNNDAYGNDLYKPDRYEAPLYPHSNSHSLGTYNDPGHVVYGSNSYEHKGYPPKGHVSVSYGQKGLGHDSYVHKTIGYEHKGYNHKGYINHNAHLPSVGPYNGHVHTFGYEPVGHSHKGFVHKGSHGYGHPTYGLDHSDAGYSFPQPGYGLAHQVHGPAYGYANQNLGVSARNIYGVDEFPYGDHLRYGYGNGIFSPYSSSEYW